MLLIFLILLTKVVADSEEDKYVDLLPDAEKQQFIEKVARRIIKDVQGQENGTKAESRELSDEQLKRHNDYVKAILKEEADNIRRSKALAKERDEKPESDEKDNLEVKPLESEKIAAPEDPDVDRIDLTLRNDRREISVSQETSTDYIKVEIVNDSAPIIKRSVQNESNKSSESEEYISETTEKVELKTEGSDKVEPTTIQPIIVTSTTTTEPTITTTEEMKFIELGSIEAEIVETTNDSSPNVVIPVNVQAETKTNDSKVEVKKKVSKNKELEPIESTTKTERRNGDIKPIIKPKRNDSDETDEDYVLVKGDDDTGLRKSNDENALSAVNETSDSTTPAVENSSVKPAENTTDEVSNPPIPNIEDVTTSTSTTQSTTSTTTTTTEKTTTEQVIQRNLVTTHNFGEVLEQPTTIINGVRTNNEDTTAKKVLTTTEYPSTVTFTSTLSDEGTTKAVAETTITNKQSTRVLTTEASAEPIATEHSTESIITPATTEEMKIVVEDFTSMPTRTTVNYETSNYETATTEAPKKKSKKKKLKLTIKARAVDLQGLITKIPEVKNHTIENVTMHKTTAEKHTQTAKPTVIMHKLEKTIIGPKGKRLLKEKEKKLKEKRLKDSVNNNFIELGKVYYDNNYKVKTGKEYRVYEIPADKSPFIPDEEFMSDQPYYVPVYNYSPDNAYFNPVNRLGPNADESSDDIGFTIGDVDDDKEITRDNQRKKFVTQEYNATHIHKQLPPIYPPKSRGKVQSEDYIDSDYYFGRSRKDLERRVNQNNLDFFPNSDETEHPVHSIQELSLKDHVRAVRNILFHQKSFGLVGRTNQKDIQRLDDRVKSIKSKKDDEDNSAVRSGLESSTDEGTLTKKEGADKQNVNNIAMDYYFGRTRPTAVITSDVKKEDKENYFQKVGYLKNDNNTKELYVMDDLFKDNVVKYIKELKSKHDTYVKSDLIPLKLKSKGTSRFRNEEKQRNAEIMKKLDILEAENKAVRSVFPVEYDTDKRTATETSITANDDDDIKNETAKSLNDTNFDLETDNDNFTELMNSTVQEQFNLTMNRRNYVFKVGVYLRVLKDMIMLDDKALKQYDWLGTAVDTQSSLEKLFELTELTLKEEELHPSDTEILKYIVFQYKLANEIMEANDFGSQLRKKLVLKRDRKKKLPSRLLRQKGLINRVWLYLRREVNNADENNIIKNFKKFLMDIEDGLYELHVAIKNIAKITKYGKQHWYQNLKDLYLSTDEKHLLELLLHMTVSRLFELIEESAKNGLEDGYVDYMKTHKKEAKRTLEEMMFVIQTLEEINKIVE